LDLTLCVPTRTLEVLGVNTCFVYDPNRIIRPRYGKSYGRKLRTISAGAYFQIEFEHVAEPVVGQLTDGRLAVCDGAAGLENT
jgi:hypothetical protein